MKRSPAILLPLSMLLILGSGLACRKPKVAKVAVDPFAGKSASEILASGELYLSNGRWDEGRKILRVIEERMPSSPEFSKAKLLIADSFFFGASNAYPEALVEYKSFLSYFPRDDRRDYALYRIALCHYVSIENAERDQAETRKALNAFQDIIKEAPGSIYALDAKSKITQCWRRLAEAELMVGIFYVKSYHYAGAELRIKTLLETYPEYVDRERAYYFLAEAMRKKPVPVELINQFQKDYVGKLGKDDITSLSKEEGEVYARKAAVMIKEEQAKYAQEAKGLYRKLVESYPGGDWSGKARERLIEMGQSTQKEELDS